MVIDYLFILIPKLFRDSNNLTNLTKNKSNKPNKKELVKVIYLLPIGGCIDFFAFRYLFAPVVAVNWEQV